jgi:F0F1-type ATP synthase epsilon subunit
MGASINDALARRVAQDGPAGQAAQTGLNIISDHARNAAEIQENARNQRILAEAEAIRARQRSKAGNTGSR